MKRTGLLAVIAMSVRASSSLVIPRVGVSFSPAGLLTPFHLGVASRLKELGWIRSSTALAGASGGALAAVISALEVPSSVSLGSCCKIAERCRDQGTYRTLSLALRDELELRISPSAADELNSRQAPTRIGYTEISPAFFTPRFVDQFANREDLLAVVTASCCIPFYFSGSLAPAVRGGLGCDGFFAMPRHRFGCPETFASELEILVTPFNPAVVGLEPRTVLAETARVSIISPALLQGGDSGLWPYSSSQLLKLALSPPADSDVEIAAVYKALFQAGEASAGSWDKQQVSTRVD